MRGQNIVAISKYIEKGKKAHQKNETALNFQKYPEN